MLIFSGNVVEICCGILFIPSQKNIEQTRIVYERREEKPMAQNGWKKRQRFCRDVDQVGGQSNTNVHVYRYYWS